MCFLKTHFFVAAGDTKAVWLFISGEKISVGEAGHVQRIFLFRDLHVLPFSTMAFSSSFFYE
jgi:hypothetical protein